MEIHEIPHHLSKLMVNLFQEPRQDISAQTSLSPPLSTEADNLTTTPAEPPELRRTNCTPPAIEQFPRPIIGPSARKHGALIFHVIICIYSFIGLAIVCDDYFVTSLDRICEGKQTYRMSKTRGISNN